MYYRPADWHDHKTLWLAWPYDASLWGEHLLPCQQEFTQLIMALDQERLVVLGADDVVLQDAKRRLPERPGLSFLVCPYADIWLRDTLPLMVKDKEGQNAAVIPTFNGWGHKYFFAQDQDINQRVARLWQCPALTSAMVFEGGALDFDGLGSVLTTEQCLLNRNRNPSYNKAMVEAELKRLFGLDRVIWLNQGLLNDHTDGHIDTLARFIAPQTVAIMMPKNSDDPNYEALLAIKETLTTARHKDGEPFKLVELPSPGEVLNEEGKIMPASYVNFVRGDHTVVMPTYGVAYDHEALAILSAALPTMKVVGSSAKAILSGGGAFHCITQEVFDN